jgi:predicted PurR-regulated permease PerM
MPDDRIETRAAARQRQLLWAALAIVALWIVVKLSPILSPFLFAAILAYICNPAVSALARRGLPRSLGSLLMLLLVGLVVAGLVLVIVPLVQEQAVRIAAKVPAAVEAFNRDFSPWLKKRLGIDLRLDPVGLSKFANEHRAQLEAIAGNLVDSITSRGLALIGLVASLFLIPVVMFYLLADWNGLLARLGELIPRRWQARATALAGEVDSVLGQFLRGQIAVMVVLAIYYSLGLAIAGLDFALPVGLLTGLLVFIPYLGFGLGLLLAVLTALLQAGGLGPLLGVAIVYGAGQMLESFFLTPYLVGEKIGLHPVAVIFALLAFGQLFGFFGVLLALPASAALLVGLRALRQEYLSSDFYVRP